MNIIYKKIIALSLAIMSVTAFAGCDNNDSSDQQETTAVQSTVAPTTVDPAYLEKTADLIFDGFYSSTKEDKKKQFANFVKAATEQGYNLEIGSDIGKRFHTTIFYELGAANYTYVMLHNLLKNYITYMKSECEELPDKDIKDLD